MNLPNRTLFHGDNLDLMRGMDSECVDLIATDPPFNSNANYAAFDDDGVSSEWKDIWTLDEVDIAWADLLKIRKPDVAEFLQGGWLTDSDKSYLIYMAMRIEQMHRILKPSGSIYLQCDDLMSHSLKILMDLFFGRNNFRNHITWKRSTRSDGNQWGRTSDHIMFYTKTDDYHWKDVMVSQDEKYIKKNYTQSDHRVKKYGKFRPSEITGPTKKIGNGESYMPWRGVDPAANAMRCWSPPKNGDYARSIEEHFIPGYRSIKSVHARMDALEEADLIVWPQRGYGVPRVKMYKNLKETKKCNDIWTDIAKVGKERHYGTEKPLNLVRRMIQASCPEDGVVFDPFAGCATTCVAAEIERREWWGADIKADAQRLVQKRIRDGKKKDGLGPIVAGLVTLIDKAPNLAKEFVRKTAKQMKQAKAFFFERQDGKCNGCSREIEFDLFEIDHVDPAKDEDGRKDDSDDNLQLLCASCNRTKSNRPMEYLMARLRMKSLV